MHAYSACDIGKKRTENQDCLMTEEFENGVLAFVCDGMGGMENGAEASRIAVDAVKIMFREQYQPQMDSDAVCALLRECTSAANKAVYRFAVSGDSRIRMGTTIVGAFVREGLACLINVGDSRAYLIRSAGEAEQITLDHTVVQLLFERGDITAEERLTHPRRNELTRAVGVSNRVLADSYEVKLSADEKLLLCSDGLYNLVSAEEIADTVRRLPANEVPAALVNAANEKGGRDNISVVLLAG